MSKRESITRYNLIINKLRKQPTTLKKINAYLTQQGELEGYKLVMTPKTFKRDLNDILSLYHIEIQYNFSKKVYEIKTDSQSEASNRLFEAFDTFNALNITDGLSQYVIFEKRKPKGTENLFGLLHAIKNRLRITFAFRDFWEVEGHHYLAEPYALKEFKNRWYILAKDVSDAKLRRFPLDRLTGLEITKKTFEKPINNEIEEIYRDCFGIIPPNESNPTEVILSFDGDQGNYITSLPLHQSQEVIINTMDELRIKLKVYITYDFIMELLSYGDTVEVIAPESLKKQIKETLEKSLSYYT
jgi:hypothetical protein